MTAGPNVLLEHGVFESLCDLADICALERLPTRRSACTVVSGQCDDGGGGELNRHAQDRRASSLILVLHDVG
ncbi:uncharacterized protein LAJ45_05165 [Morchella importuna]|uniref:uncharacterized protein n=1 Tax=Morchella importuna TaxID=1174673 RepID=UPI001E8E4B72|nr:uncharacterized protein LAJ45_05165 [Morchella importuna]KAH8150982.1 hypothetical protein LAJ45_05165 [Morchella importuna]